MIFCLSAFLADTLSGQLIFLSTAASARQSSSSCSQVRGRELYILYSPPGTLQEYTNKPNLNCLLWKTDDMNNLTVP